MYVTTECCNLYRFISSLPFTQFDLTNLPQYHLMLCSLRWSRDQHSLVSLFPVRPVVLSIHYLALKRLLSATRRILNEGDAKVGTVGTTCQAFATNSMSWAWRDRRPDGPVNVWWSISIVWVGQCTRSDICHQGRKWLERYVPSRLLHRMLSAQHPLSSSFLPAEGRKLASSVKLACKKMESVWATNLMVSNLQGLKTWQFEGSFEKEEGVGQKPRGL
jgi:hypothetical protein